MSGIIKNLLLVLIVTATGSAVATSIPGIKKAADEKSPASGPKRLLISELIQLKHEATGTSKGLTEVAKIPGLLEDVLKEGLQKTFSHIVKLDPGEIKIADLEKITEAGEKYTPEEEKGFYQLAMLVRMERMKAEDKRTGNARTNARLMEDMTKFALSAFPQGGGYSVNLPQSTADKLPEGVATPGKSLAPPGQKSVSPEKLKEAIDQAKRQNPGKDNPLGLGMKDLFNLAVGSNADAFDQLGDGYTDKMGGLFGFHPENLKAFDPQSFELFRTRLQSMAPALDKGGAPEVPQPVGPPPRGGGIGQGAGGGGHFVPGMDANLGAGNGGTIAVPPGFGRAQDYMPDVKFTQKEINDLLRAQPGRTSIAMGIGRKVGGDFAGSICQATPVYSTQDSQPKPTKAVGLGIPVPDEKVEACRFVIASANHCFAKLTREKMVYLDGFALGIPAERRKVYPPIGDFVTMAFEAPCSSKFNTVEPASASEQESVQANGCNTAVVDVHMHGPAPLPGKLAPVNSNYTQFNVVGTQGVVPGDSGGGDKCVFCYANGCKQKLIGSNSSKYVDSYYRDGVGFVAMPPPNYLQTMWNGGLGQFVTDPLGQDEITHATLHPSGAPVRSVSSETETNNGIAWRQPTSLGHGNY